MPARPAAPARVACRPTEPDALLVAAQLGRVPRAPWRVGARCAWGFPTVAVSPSRLADGTPFPNYAWLTCPYLVEIASAGESEGQTARWAERARSDAALAEQLAETDRAVRERRRAESDGDDACAAVGIAGQRDPLGVKCLHAHLALALVGIADPIGDELLEAVDAACPDCRCARLNTHATPSDDVGRAKEES